ncbi:CRASP family complement regulator-acquiring lipoprotein [Borreliella americana]|uniref:CRASP family complement regulator-acquiring lipoprotein n=1 Tax=Borreliella americana TaxID=478807 RepID=UPI001E3E14D0|nr:CRASP family complement regulator-acquiring lipoprotein [Borreliella americana]MCD2332706.1 lipoprotein P35 [Borreliella americana]
MKYNIIVSILVFLLLACNPYFNTNKKDTKHQSIKKEKSKSTNNGSKTNIKISQNQKENSNSRKKEVSNQKEEEKKIISNQKENSNSRKKEVSNQKEEEKDKDTNRKISNTSLDDLRNLIETANLDREKDIKKLKEETSEQYGMLAAFELLHWGTPPDENKKISDNVPRSKEFRRQIYSFLNPVDANEYKKFAEIIILTGHKYYLLNELYEFGILFDNTIDTIVKLYSKKDTMNKLNNSTLENLKNSFKKLLSTKIIVSKMFKQFLLDDENNKYLIKKDTLKLAPRIDSIFDQIRTTKDEANELNNIISSIYKNI